MVNYGRLYALRRHLEALGFEVTITTHNEPYNFESYVGFEVSGITSYGCWRKDEQIAVNQAADKLSEVYSAMIYWSNKSR